MSLNFASRINSYYDDFSLSERKIADFLIEHPDAACYMSIQELASTCKTSNASVSRFAKKIGCQNFQQLRMMLGKSNPVNAQTFFKSANENDSLLDIVTKHFFSGVNSLSQTQTVLTEEQLGQAKTIMQKASICGLFGLGGSCVVTLNAYHRFIRTSLTCLYAADFHMQLMNAAKLTKHDCAIVISHTGRNKDILRIVRILRENEVPIIAVSSNAASKLVKNSTVSFLSVSEETDYRPEAIASMVSQLSIVDSLFMIYALKVDGKAEYFSKIRTVITETRDNSKR